jgi:Heparinase II/III-like protein/Heparinase II/III N-terminus
VLSELGWYARRLQRMSPREVVGRAGDRFHQHGWSHGAFSNPRWYPGPLREDGARKLVASVDLDTLAPAGRRRILATADEIMAGRFELLGVVRDDLDAPDWHRDPVSGDSYPSATRAFRLHLRRQDDQRRIKHVWELSRHHQLTVLALAWRLTGDHAYAERVGRQLRDWWEHNPVGTGVNWTSGIELGIRLISWTWTRRLLDAWPGVGGLFEHSDAARRQIYWHQRFLATFPSRGSSANNHLIAEAAGQLAASCAFPWFDQSDGWREESAVLLQDALRANSFPSGLNREQAFEYHGLVAELGLLSVLEAEVAGEPVRPATWRLLGRVFDSLAASLDETGAPPRYGDGDDGRVLLLDDPRADRWASLLALGDAVLGPASLGPSREPDARSLLLGSLVRREIDVGTRLTQRPAHFPDAGLTILRRTVGGRELWCRCDGGPQGFLSTSAHGHADALSIEVRHGGVEVLCDPGTYCYQGDPTWRRYFRSTIAHNTVEVDGLDQAEAGGPFLWTRHADATVTEVAIDDTCELRWVAEHDGYQRLANAVDHRRTVAIDEVGTMTIVDCLTASLPHDIRLAFHLGPAVRALLDGRVAILDWEAPDGAAVRATLELPPALNWRAHRGQSDPLLGWYSPAFGSLQPTTTLVGSGRCGSVRLSTRLVWST